MSRSRRVGRPAARGTTLGGRPALRIGWLLAAVLPAACAGTLAATVKAPSALGPPEAFACAERELVALGYHPGAFDRDAGRLVASKADPRAKRPHTLSLRVLDRLEVETAGNEAGSLLIVRARTFHEFGSQRGPTEEEERASETARADAAALLERCKQ